MSPEEREEKRLEIEAKRLTIEKCKLRIERDKAKSDSKLLNRHSGTFVAIAATLVSLAQILNSYIIAQNQQALEVQKYESEKLEKIMVRLRGLKNADPLIKEATMQELITLHGQETIANILIRFEKSESQDAQAIGKEGLQYIQDANLEAQFNLQAWVGTWNHTFRSRNSTFVGEMRLKVIQSETANESYISGDFDANDRSITGTIEKGKLTANNTILTGTWRNSLNQWGEFSFQLQQEPASDSQSILFNFDGRYAMLGNKPDIHSSLSWTGTRVSAQTSGQ